MGPEIYKAGKLQLFRADCSLIRPIPSKNIAEVDKNCILHFEAWREQRIFSS